jgi:hypothetical protein
MGWVQHACICCLFTCYTQAGYQPKQDLDWVRSRPSWTGPSPIMQCLLLLLNTKPDTHRPGATPCSACSCCLLYYKNA